MWRSGVNWMQVCENDWIQVCILFLELTKNRRFKIALNRASESTNCHV